MRSPFDTATQPPVQNRALCAHSWRPASCGMFGIGVENENPPADTVPGTAVMMSTDCAQVACVGPHAAPGPIGSRSAGRHVPTTRMPTVAVPRHCGDDVTVNVAFPIVGLPAHETVGMPNGMLQPQPVAAGI